MGSKQIKDMGLERSGDLVEGAPESFTVLGVDVTVDALIKRFEGHPTEIAIIRGVIQERRSAPGVLAPPRFVRSLMGGVSEPVQFFRLKAPEGRGKDVLLIAKGNNRTVGLRRANDQREAKGLARFNLKGIQISSIGKSNVAGMFASEQHALSNVRVRVLPSQNAETAARLKFQGMSTLDIVSYCDGVETEEEVLELIALGECGEAFQDAVDAGKVPVKAALRVAKMSGAVAAEWLAARLAPPRQRGVAASTARPLSPARRTLFLSTIDAAADPAAIELAGILAGTVGREEVKHWKAEWEKAFGGGASEGSGVK